MSRLDLNDAVVAITGSTGGLGSALATALQARGARLALLDLDLQSAQAQARKLGDVNVAHGWAVNVRSMESVQAAMDAAAAHFGGIDVVIANAGIDTMAPMEILDPAAFDRVIDINLNGVWRTFKAALPYVKQSRGHLVAVSSMAAFVHSPLQASYTASKAGVWAMSDSLRLEVRPYGVTLGTVHPTFFRTPMTEDVVADPAGRKLWGGHERSPFKFIPIEDVIAATVRGIEQRSDLVVVPRSLAVVARAPGLFRKTLERIGFKDQTVREAMALASPAGWHDESAARRTNH